jgi:ATP-dependent RNA helicase SUPV3L1/SUV3
LEINKLFTEIEANLESSRKVLIKTSYDQDSEELRSLLDSKFILNILKEIAVRAHTLITDHPSLETTFEKQFGKFSHFVSRENIIDTCLQEDYLFAYTQEFPLTPGEELNHELVQNYYLSFNDWAKEVSDKHILAQETIFNKFNLEIKHSEIPCHCLKCTADYRGKIRETIYNEQISVIDKSEEQLHELILTQKINYCSDYVSKLKKRVDKNLASVKYKLKRGSLNKLNSDVKAHLKRKFGYKSEIGQVYKEVLKTYFNGLLSEMGHSPDLLTDSEYERFFTQLNVGIWKNSHTLKREFEKLIRAVLAFKRKDISATILRDYLGQFWIHADARRKNRKVIYHMGPTNSGKTWNSIEALSKANKGCYLAPLRLLASELFDTLNEKGCKTNLLTGEEVIEVENATHYSSTIEMARLNEEFDCVVIDEIQMITDTQRGWAWTRALVNINADEIHLAGDGSVYELVKQILSLTGDSLEVRKYERKTNLTVMKEPIKLVDLDKNDALIVFSRRNALKYKRDLENLDFKVSIVYGRLSPEVRREQARKFDEGETDIIVATDAIAMGMNLPIKRIVFSAIAKFYDGKEHPLTNSELKQIAGRAGRFQRFPEGYVTTLQKVDDGLETIKTALNHNLKQRELAMVGPDLDIFRSVNMALEESNLKTLKLSEFLQLFNTMTFEKPFYCVELKEMIELAETVEDADTMEILTDAEIFGFACAPVNQGLLEHVQYYVWILNHFVGNNSIVNEKIDSSSDDIDYLETAIKCVELYQWLARHFDNKNFAYDIDDLLGNKASAIERLNGLLSEKISKKCSSCGEKVADDSRFNICETCFAQRRRGRGSYSKAKDGNENRKRGPGGSRRSSSSGSGSGSGNKSYRKKKNDDSKPVRSGSSASSNTSKKTKQKKPKSKAAIFKKG